MTQVVDAETAPSAIRDTAVQVAGKRYRFTEDRGKYFVTYPDPFRGGMLMRRELLMMTGSHHLHVFWHSSDVVGTPAQLDIVYLIDQERWIPRESSFLQPPDHHAGLELGTWNRTCSRCHSTHPKERYVKQDGHWETVVAEFGIACEACHGPAETHVEFHLAKQANSLSVAANDIATLSGEPAQLTDRIVNPAELSKQASADVCGQCHSVFLPDYDVITQEDYEQNGNPFRPGDLLNEVQFTKVIRASAEHRSSDAFRKWSEMESVGGAFWADGMPRIAGREYNGLIESPCFEKGSMTCLSCHQMHGGEQNFSLNPQAIEDWKNDQLAEGMNDDHACLQCHSDFAQNIAAHSHHAVSSEGSRCMNCHMPYTTYGLLKTIRSHQITSPSIEDSQRTDRANACLLCHLDQNYDWAAQYLHEWYGQPWEKPAGESETGTISTSALHLLSGDAAQRVIQVSAMGWGPAQQASGTDWMEPYLLLAANDPYDAVRIVAEQTLGKLPKRISEPMDALSPPTLRMQSFNTAIQQLDREMKATPNPKVLIDADGKFDFLRARKFLEHRNNNPVHLRE